MFFTFNFDLRIPFSNVTADVEKKPAFIAEK
jgi:hypothetical protein